MYTFTTLLWDFNQGGPGERGRTTKKPTTKSAMWWGEVWWGGWTEVRRWFGWLVEALSRCKQSHSWQWAIISWPQKLEHNREPDHKVRICLAALPCPRAPVAEEHSLREGRRTTRTLCDLFVRSYWSNQNSVEKVLKAMGLTKWLRIIRYSIWRTAFI